MMKFPNTLEDALTRARGKLLAERNACGHWEGELSSSALSTAVTVCALSAFHASAQPGGEEREKLKALTKRGRQWLAAHQNEDGGWGDTVISLSNISTTALCWAAFAGHDEAFRETVDRCEAWLGHAVASALALDSASLEPTQLATAIRRRYGKDHTFSVPILTTLALTGRLGEAKSAWKLVPQLPFELAAFPRAWFARLKLPVVSYALPALIAIGQVRFHHAAGWNLPLVALRKLVRKRTLKVLREIQPSSGGYLEASPLTSFVSLSLIRAEQADSPVVRSGVDFLVNSVREDGSWAIDTNLATWVTTLSLNALASGGKLSQNLPASQLATIKSWLLDQQYREVHPYTHAAPGGWAWTNLTGGVPDADDTPGAILAIAELSREDGSSENTANTSAAEAGIGWLLDLQNSDGGMPTFCRGWGTLPFDRSSADLTAHAIRAFHAWSDRMPAPIQQRMAKATQRGLAFLARHQRTDGAWTPLWFGNQHLGEEENPVYGTSRVLLAAMEVVHLESGQTFMEPTRRGLAWLVKVQNTDGGWNGGEPGGPSSIEETALALEALLAALDSGQLFELLDNSPLRTDIESAVTRGLEALLSLTDDGNHFPAAPIGFYFAKLWYFERLYPIIFSTSVLERTVARKNALLRSVSTPADQPPATSHQPSATGVQ